MNNHNLFDVWQLDKVDHTEFASLLSEHFHSARQVSLKETVFPSNENDYSVKLTYDKEDRLTKVSRGPSLTDYELELITERVVSELLTSTGTQVGREILFADVPVTGYFRYGSMFQILSVPKGAPQPRFDLADHPFLLEFRFNTSTNLSICSVRRNVQGRQLQLLLTGLLEGPVRWLDHVARFYWVTLPRRPGEKWETADCCESYTYPNLKLVVDDFSPTESLPELQAVVPQKYYARSGISSDDVLEIPSNFGSMLDRFYTLPEENQKRFLQACFWLQHARLVHSHSRSAYYTALICTVEALIPRERGAPICSECNRSKGKGLTRLFKEFVDRYALAGEDFQVNRREFYDVRSRLSHGGRLLATDREGLFGPFHSRMDEWEKLRAIRCLVKGVLVGWLETQA